MVLSSGDTDMSIPRPERAKRALPESLRGRSGSLADGVYHPGSQRTLPTPARLLCLLLLWCTCVVCVDAGHITKEIKRIEHDAVSLDSRVQVGNCFHRTRRSRICTQRENTDIVRDATLMHVQLSRTKQAAAMVSAVQVRGFAERNCNIHRDATRPSTTARRKGHATSSLLRHAKVPTERPE
jgi:hypothetical protein